MSRKIPVRDIQAIAHAVQDHVQTSIGGHKRTTVAARLGMGARAGDNYLEAAYRALRTAMMKLVKRCKDADRLSWYDLVEALNERHAAKELRRQSYKKGEGSTSQHQRSSSQHECFSFKGAASKVAPERSTITREGAASAASAAKMRAKRRENEVARSAA